MESLESIFIPSAIDILTESALNLSAKLVEEEIASEIGLEVSESPEPVVEGEEV